jgi:hypothetical protein
MIKASELRIGNRVHSPTHNLLYCTVCGLLPDANIVLLREFSTYDHFDKIEPVPVSPALMKRCGFVNGGSHDGGDSSWRHPDFPFGLTDTNGALGFSVYYLNDIDYAYPAEVDFIHELQNLFYDHTKKELTINL